MGEKPFLNTVRWMSAVLVMLGHAAAWSMAIGSSLPWPGKAARYIYDLGGPAVIIFFVVSGYLVGGSALSRGASLSWRDYSASRIARIYVVIVPALLLTASLDGLVHALDPRN